MTEPRARRHPFAAVLLLALDAIPGFAMAYQAKETLRVASGNHPHGDAGLLQDGALGLVDFVFHQPAALTGILATFALTTALSLLVRPWVTVAYLARLGGASPRKALARGTLLYGRALAASILLALVQGLTLGLFGFSASVLANKLAPRWGEPRADQLALVVLFAGALGAVLVGILRDLTLGALAVRRRSLLQSLLLAVRTARRNARSLALGYLVRAAFGGALFLLMTLGASAAPTALLGFLLRRAALLSRGAAHVSWLSLALRAVLRTAEAPQIRESDTPSRTDAPPGPTLDPAA